MWTAKHRMARISPRKARLVVELIRGRDLQTAMHQLQFTEKKASHLVDQVLRAAMSYAEAADADMRSLYVAHAIVNEGPRMKRFQPKDRGRAHPIVKCTSHIEIGVAQREEAEKAERRRPRKPVEAPAGDTDAATAPDLAVQPAPAATPALAASAAEPVAPAVVAEAPAVVGEAPAVVAEAPAVVAEAPAVVAEAPAVVAAPAPEGEAKST